MKDAEINIAIAETMGWTECRAAIKGAGGGTRFPTAHGKPPGRKYEADCLDYCNDLNAMHEAEACIGARWVTYCNILLEIVEPEPRSLEVCHYWNLLHATARQRAEAFLRTLGKWKEEA